MVAAASQGAAMGGAYIGGSTAISNNSSVVHNSIDEKAGVSDNQVADNLNAD